MRASSSTPMEEKIALALDLERATRGADSRVRQVSSADYSDGRVEVALASTSGIRSWSRRTTAFVSVDAIAGTARTHRLVRVQRGPLTDPSRSRRGHGRGGSALHPLARRAEGTIGPLHGGVRPRGVRLHVAFGGGVRALGEAVVKGRSFFVGRIGELVAHATVTLTDDPTDSQGVHRRFLRWGRAGMSAQRLISDGVLSKFVYDTVSAGGPRPTRRARPCAAALPVRPLPGAVPWCSRQGPKVPMRSCGRSGTGCTSNRSPASIRGESRER